MQLHNRILIGLAGGAATGLVLHAAARGSPQVDWLAENVAAPAGQVFLRLLLMTVVPLVFASLVLGIAGIGDVRRLGRTALATLAFFLVSTACSVAIGLAITRGLAPGDGLPAETRDALLEAYRAQAEGMQAGAGRFGVDMLVAIVPSNPVRAAADTQMLAVIFFSVVFGVALTRIPENQKQSMLAVVEALGTIVMRIIHGVLWLAPVGVFALIFASTYRFGWDLLQELGAYVVAVLVGLAIHSVVVLSALVATLGRTNPWRFWRGARASLVTAFSTSSSSATLPTSIAVAQGELGVPATVAGFVLPLGATLNMNGTALFEGVTVLFLASVFGVPLDAGQQLLVLAMCVVTAVGAAGVPGGSLPLLMGVLAAVGIPPEGIGVVLGIDRILDMSRTVVNVAGDLAAAVVVTRVDAARPQSDA